MTSGDPCVQNSWMIYSINFDLPWSSLHIDSPQPNCQTLSLSSATFPAPSSVDTYRFITLDSRLVNAIGEIVVEITTPIRPPFEFFTSHGVHSFYSKKSIRFSKTPCIKYTTHCIQCHMLFYVTAVIYLMTLLTDVYHIYNSK